MSFKTLFISFFLFLIQFHSLAIMEVDSKPWGFSPKVDNEYENKLKAKYPKGGFFLNLGPTGIRAKLTSKAPDRFEVMYVFDDDKSPAHGKVKIGDFIIGANGKEFKGKHVFGRKIGDKNWEGPLAELAKHIEDSQAESGQLELILADKDGNKRYEKIRLEVKGRFSPTFPWSCPRSEKMAKVLCDFIAKEYKRRRGNLGRPHTRSHSILALMANGSHDKIVKEYASKLARTNYTHSIGQFATWTWGYDGVVMGEYTHVFNSDKLKNQMKFLSDIFRHGSQIKDGKISGHFTHRSQVILTKKGRPGYASIAAISGLAMLSLSYMKQAGYEYDEEFYKILHSCYLKTVTPNSASIAYNFADRSKGKEIPEPVKPYKTTGSAGHVMPTGIGAVAHFIGNEGNKSWEYLAKHCADTSANSYYRFVDGHCGGHLHAFWGLAGVAYADAKKQRKYLDYLKTFLILSETHYDGAMVLQPWNRDRKSTNTDQRYGFRLLPTATAAFLLSLPKKRLLINGAMKKNSPVHIGSSTIKKPIPDIRRPMKLSPKQLEKTNNILLATLIKMNTKNEIASSPIKISKTSVTVVLTKVSGTSLTFHKVDDKSKEATFKYESLSNIDRTYLALLVAASKPESKTANALASIYLENFGSKKNTDIYLKKTSKEMLDKVENYITSD